MALLTQRHQHHYKRENAREEARFGYIEAVVLLPLVFNTLYILIAHRTFDFAAFIMFFYAIAVIKNYIHVKQIVLLSQMGFTIYTLVNSYTTLQITSIGYTLGYILALGAAFTVVSQNHRKMKVKE